MWRRSGQSPCRRPARCTGAEAGRSTTKHHPRVLERRICSPGSAPEQFRGLVPATAAAVVTCFPRGPSSSSGATWTRSPRNLCERALRGGEEALAGALRLLHYFILGVLLVQTKKQRQRTGTTREAMDQEMDQEPTLMVHVSGRSTSSTPRRPSAGLARQLLPFTLLVRPIQHSYMVTHSSAFTAESCACRADIRRSEHIGAKGRWESYLRGQGA